MRIIPALNGSLIASLCASSLRRALLLVLVAVMRATTVAAQSLPPDSTTGCRCDGYLDQAATAVNEGRYAPALDLLDQAMDHAKADRDNDLIGRVLVQQAIVHQVLGDYNTSLKLLYQDLRLCERMADQDGLAEANNNIGSIHHVQKEYAMAEDYYGRSLAIYERLGLRRKVASSYNNFGALYEDMGQPERAAGFHRRSLAIWQELGDRGWMAVSFLHLGTCLARLGEPDSARTYLFKSAAIMEERHNKYQLSKIQIEIGNNYLGEGNSTLALAWCRKGLRLADDLGIVPFQEQGCECLYRAYEKLGDNGRALAFYKRFIVLRDSVFGQQNVKEMTRIEMSHTFAERQLADSMSQAGEKLKADLAYHDGLAREREKRNIILFSGIGVLLLAGGLWNRLRFVRRSRAVIQRERDRSDDLLLNILPKDIAEELKENGSARARDIDNVSILFTDFKGFTRMSEVLTAQELVAEIDTCFKAFDAIVTRHGVEKIKTIGDAYMAAAGLSTLTHDAAASAVHAALDMQDFMRRYAADREAQHLPAFTMRVGIHTGPVVAGIVGDKKFAYDIWGDTVNIASRMESTGAEGEVNISGSTWAQVRDLPGVSFTPRGRVEAKGKGEMEMYYAARR